VEQLIRGPVPEVAIHNQKLLWSDYGDIETGGVTEESRLSYGVFGRLNEFEINPRTLLALVAID